eukprot:CAMPEP_0170497686 /NCGR_PEP_ID=MMETSP0208-20121228/25428_1 /TAXON_ID=197538 /ORGANISM="Strombidium inclinatum, Strain S3" /LENGTH=69 /DNA_ID=CAMNT_0010774579 /DNA_START=17 /DNA_END=226 /DNA_ORIENTATION=-
MDCANHIARLQARFYQGLPELDQDICAILTAASEGPKAQDKQALFSSCYSSQPTAANSTADSDEDEDEI